MHISIIFRVLGLLLMLFSLTLIPPVLVSVLFADATHMAFWFSFAITFGAGFCMWFPVHNIRQDLRTRDGFLITALFWIVLGLFGSLPFPVSRDPLPLVVRTSAWWRVFAAWRLRWSRWFRF